MINYLQDENHHLHGPFIDGSSGKARETLRDFQQ